MAYNSFYSGLDHNRKRTAGIRAAHAAAAKRNASKPYVIVDSNGKEKARCATRMDAYNLLVHSIAGADYSVEYRPH
jgi:hypothetical protein